VLVLGIISAWRERGLVGIDLRADPKTGSGGASTPASAPIRSIRSNNPLTALYADLTAGLPWLLALAALFGLFLGINRGLAIFDDYTNLPLVSMIASGDVPPHFYLNPEIELDYHYGMHLLAGSLVRIGGFYPWSALDLYKAISIALATVLGMLWYRRTMRPWAAIVLGGLFVLFAGGARWLLLLLPPGWLETLGRDVELVGSAMQSARNLPLALTGPWRIEGDGPMPFLFAFVSGVVQPLTMAMTSSGAWPTATVFLLLLAGKRRWRPLSGIVFGLLVAALAPVSEHLFLIVWGALVVAALVYSLQQRSLRAALDWLWPILPGALLAPLMGGVVSGTIERLLAQGSGGLAQGTATMPGVALRWPPAIFSAHLGALELFRPAQLALALIEIGPLLLLAVPVTLAIPGFIRRRKLLAAGMALMAILSLCAPMVVRFVERERDISRLFGAALTLWAALGLPYAWQLFQRGGPQRRALLGLLFAAAILGGLALLPAQLVARLQPQPSYFIQEADVWMSRQHWERLEPGAWVLDPVFPFRPAALFARTTGPAYESVYIETNVFLALMGDPTPQAAAAAGYAYIYLERKTWSEMSAEQKRPYQDGCAILVDETRDKMGDFRRLYDIRGCAVASQAP
jgi:hypothetical protein